MATLYKLRYEAEDLPAMISLTLELRVGNKAEIWLTEQLGEQCQIRLADVNAIPLDAMTLVLRIPSVDLSLFIMRTEEVTTFEICCPGGRQIGKIDVVRGGLGPRYLLWTAGWQVVGPDF